MNNNNVIFQLININRNPSVEGVHAPNTYSLTATDTVITEDGSEKKIAYRVGEVSINENEQDTSRPLQKITFKGGRLIVNKYEKTMIEYLRSLNCNDSNPSRKENITPVFFEVEVGKEAEKAVKRKETIASVVTTIKSYSDNRAEETARALGLWIHTDTAFDTRYKIIRYGEENPDLFLELMNNEDFRKKRNIARFFSKGLVGMEGDRLVRLPSRATLTTGIDPQNQIEDLFSYFSTPDGEDKYKQLLNRANWHDNMDPATEEEKNSIKSDVDALETNELVEEAKSAKIIQQHLPYYYYAGMKGDKYPKGGEKEDRIAKDLGALRKEVGEDETLRSKIKGDLVAYKIQNLEI